MSYDFSLGRFCKYSHSEVLLLSAWHCGDLSQNQSLLRNVVYLYSTVRWMLPARGEACLQIQGASLFYRPFSLKAKSIYPLTTRRGPSGTASSPLLRSFVKPGLKCVLGNQEVYWPERPCWRRNTSSLRQAEKPFSWFCRHVVFSDDGH